MLTYYTTLLLSYRYQSYSYSKLEYKKSLPCMPTPQASRVLQTHVP